MVNDLPDFVKTGRYEVADKKYIIFAGDKVESIWTNYFNTHHGEFSTLCKENGFKFIYLREYFFDKDNLSGNEDYDLKNSFNIPDHKCEFKLSYKKLTTASPFIGHIIDKLVTYPALIYYEGYDDEFFYFWEYRLPLATGIEVTQLFNTYINSLNSKLSDKISNKSAIDCSGMVEASIRDLNYAIENLRLFGLPRSVINQALGMLRHLSHLVITTDYKIILPFFDIEIKMTPLPKAIYFLFLKHPEGIVFKDISNYKNELCQIYLMISAAENMSNISQRIDRLCNPLDNSLNEKCSRIKEAFLKHFEEDLASIYYVTGTAKEKRYILFDRNFVHWDVHWNPNDEKCNKYYVPIITRPEAIMRLLKCNL